MLVFTSAGLVLLVVLSDIAQSAELKLFTSEALNMSWYEENGQIMGNVNVTKANGDFYTGSVIRTEKGIQGKGQGLLVFGINGLIFEGNFYNGNPSGSGSITMTLPSPLANSVLAGCSGCRQERRMDGSWNLSLDGNARTGNEWVIVAKIINQNPIQHAAVFNMIDGRYAFGTILDNGSMEGSGFLKVYHKVYTYSGPLFQKCADTKAHPDEESLSSNFTTALISYWTNMESYEGEFVNGNPHGMGRMRLLTGETINGSFYRGKAICYGTITFNNAEDCGKVATEEGVVSPFDVCTQDSPHLDAFFVGGVPALWFFSPLALNG